MACVTLYETAVSTSVLYGGGGGTTTTIYSTTGGVITTTILSSSYVYSPSRKRRNLPLRRDLLNIIPQETNYVQPTSAARFEDVGWWGEYQSPAGPQPTLAPRAFEDKHLFQKRAEPYCTRNDAVVLYPLCGLCLQSVAYTCAAGVGNGCAYTQCFPAGATVVSGTYNLYQLETSTITQTIAYDSIITITSVIPGGGQTPTATSYYTNTRATATSCPASQPGTPTTPTSTPTSSRASSSSSSASLVVSTSLSSTIIVDASGTRVSVVSVAVTGTGSAVPVSTRSSGISKGAIGGIAAGAVVVIIAIVALIAVFIKKRNQRDIDAETWNDYAASTAPTGDKFESTTPPPASIAAAPGGGVGGFAPSVLGAGMAGVGAGAVAGSVMSGHSSGQGPTQSQYSHTQQQYGDHVMSERGDLSPLPSQAGTVAPSVTSGGAASTFAETQPSIMSGQSSTQQGHSYASPGSGSYVPAGDQVQHRHDHLWED
ncbi:hypothetical protein T439DRAFT_117712 [Meredithblackwellia eburnea MCA 4105]